MADTNSKTEHSKRLRALSSKKTHKKILNEGGARFTILLESPYSQLFESLAAEHGSRRKALIYLLEAHQKNS